MAAAARSRRLRFHLCLRQRALRADRGDTRHHARRRRHAESAARDRRAPRQGDDPVRRPFSAAEALKSGAWSTRCCRRRDLMPAALATAERIAANGPISVRQAKQAIHHGLQMSTLPTACVRDRGLQPPGSRPKTGSRASKPSTRSASRISRGNDSCQPRSSAAAAFSSVISTSAEPRLIAALMIATF